MADRLSADKKYVELARNEISRKDILGFGHKGENIDIYMFAFALGVNAGYKTPSSKKEGFILETAAKGKDSALSFIYSVALQELIKQNREIEITNTDVVYNIAEEYANTGFKIIEEMIPDINKYNDEEFPYVLIELLDEIIDELNL